MLPLRVRPVRHLFVCLLLAPVASQAQSVDGTFAATMPEAPVPAVSAGSPLPPAPFLVSKQKGRYVYFLYDSPARLESKYT